MDLKDISSIDVDSEHLIASGLEKLNLETASNDIFDLEDEVNKCSNLSKVENNLIETLARKECTKKFSKSVNVTVAPTELNLNQEDSDDENVLNENEDDLSADNLNNLLSGLDLSDSDNEEKTDEVGELRERGPCVPRKRISKARELAQKIYDRSEFSDEKLKSLSGGRYVETSNILYNVGSANIFGSYNTETFLNVPIWDSGEDSRNNSVSSPESGYDTCHSLTGSPPHVSLALPNINILDHLAQTVDEEVILQSVAEMEPGVFSDFPVDDKENCIEKLKNFLKDESFEKNVVLGKSNLNVQVNNVYSSENTENLAATCNKVSTIKILPKPSLDDAKKELKKFLVDDIKLQFERKMFLFHQQHKDAKVIHIEDESENRTNLHNAVINGKLEEVYCLIAYNMRQKSPCDINVRDKFDKTALDYAIDKDMTLVVNYLLENNAKPTVKI